MIYALSLLLLFLRLSARSTQEHTGEQSLGTQVTAHEPLDDLDRGPEPGLRLSRDEILEALEREALAGLPVDPVAPSPFLEHLRERLGHVLRADLAGDQELAQRVDLVVVLDERVGMPIDAHGASPVSSQRFAKRRRRSRSSTVAAPIVRTPTA